VLTCGHTLCCVCCCSFDESLADVQLFWANISWMAVQAGKVVLALTSCLHDPTLTAVDMVHFTMQISAAPLAVTHVVGGCKIVW